MRDDGEITNDSRDVNWDLQISKLDVTLKPTATAITSDQAMKIIVGMETILMANLKFESDSLALISSIELDKNPELEFIPSRRMLRNGKQLSDGAEISARSIVRVMGGSANSTFSIDHAFPTEDELDAAIPKILNDKLLNWLLSEPEFESLTEVVVAPYVDETPSPPSGSSSNPRTEIITEPIGGGSSVAISASLGTLIALILAVGIAYRSWKKGSFKKIGNRYHEARNSLKMSSLRRSKSRNDDEEYLVEICTDQLEPPSKVKKVGDQEISPKNGFRGLPFLNNMHSPTNMKGRNKRDEGLKTIDPSDYVIEVGTE